MNILVTGANGQLGNEMRLIAARHFDAPCHSGDPCHSERSEESHSDEVRNCRHSDEERSEGEDSHWTFTDIVAQEGAETTILDITDLDAVRKIVRERKVDVIVNCAAYTNVDAAESNFELAERLNAQAPENLALAMKEAGGLLVHISTDYVFGADPYNTPCREEQKGTPTGVYGLTKLHGEQRIIASGCDHVIIRTAWLYSEYGKNFVKTMLRLTAEKPSLKVVFDQVGTPTYALDLARAIMAVLRDYRRHSERSPRHSDRSEESHPDASRLSDPECSPRLSERSEESPARHYPHSGIYHYSNEGVCSWYDFAKAIARMGGRDACDIQPCHSCEFPSPVVRPAYSVLDKTKIKETFALSVPYWTDSLRNCLANMGIISNDENG